MGLCLLHTPCSAILSLGSRRRRAPTTVQTLPDLRLEKLHALERQRAKSSPTPPIVPTPRVIQCAQIPLCAGQTILETALLQQIIGTVLTELVDEILLVPLSPDL